MSCNWFLIFLSCNDVSNHMCGSISISHNENFIHFVNSIYLLFSKCAVNLFCFSSYAKTGYEEFNWRNFVSFSFIYAYLFCTLHFKWRCYYRNVSGWFLSWELFVDKSLSFLLLLTWFLASAIPQYLHQSKTLESEHSKSSWSPFLSSGWTLWDVRTCLRILFIRN